MKRDDNTVTLGEGIQIVDVLLGLLVLLVALLAYVCPQPIEIKGPGEPVLSKPERGSSSPGNREERTRGDQDTSSAPTHSWTQNSLPPTEPSADSRQEQEAPILQQEPPETRVNNRQNDSAVHAERNKRNSLKQNPSDGYSIQEYKDRELSETTKRRLKRIE